MTSEQFIETNQHRFAVLWDPNARKGRLVVKGQPHQEMAKVLWRNSQGENSYIGLRLMNGNSGIIFIENGELEWQVME